VTLTVADIRRRSQILEGMEKSGTIGIAGAMYDLESGSVDFVS
jgi:hypothetical protein